MTLPDAAKPLDTPSTYSLMPFRFAWLSGTGGKVVVTSEGGEFAFLGTDELVNLPLMSPLAEETRNVKACCSSAHRRGPGEPL
jgi:hypothetical protein